MRPDWGAGTRAPVPWTGCAAGGPYALGGDDGDGGDGPDEAVRVRVTAAARPRESEEEVAEGQGVSEGRRQRDTQPNLTENCQSEADASPEPPPAASFNEALLRPSSTRLGPRVPPAAPAGPACAAPLTAAQGPQGHSRPLTLGASKVLLGDLAAPDRQGKATRKVDGRCTVPNATKINSQTNKVRKVHLVHLVDTHVDGTGRVNGGGAPSAP